MRAPKRAHAWETTRLVSASSKSHTGTANSARTASGSLRRGRQDPDTDTGPGSGAHAATASGDASSPSASDEDSDHGTYVQVDGDSDGAPDPFSVGNNAQLLNALLLRTRRTEDRAKLARAMRGVAAAEDWPAAFAGRASVTAEEFRRFNAQRIVDALRKLNRMEAPLAPRSDDLDAMWEAFPTQDFGQRRDYWWANGTPNPKVDDPRLPPPSNRGRTVDAGGLYEYHCRGCRRHDRSADGALLDDRGHWACNIHPQLFAISNIRLPLASDTRPSTTVLREQVLERDPALALAGAAEVAARVKSGSMVYADRGEPLLVVPSKLVPKWSLRQSPEDAAVAADGVKRPNYRAICARAIVRGKEIAAAAVAADSPDTPPGDAVRTAWRNACGPFRVRWVACHNLGVNLLTISTPLTYGPLEDLAGHVGMPATDYSIVWNDHKGGYNALHLHPAHRPLCAVWDPTVPDVILMPTTLDFGLSNAPFLFSVFTAMLQWNIVWWLGADGWSLYYLDDNGVICRADRVPLLLAELDEMAARCGYEYSAPKRQTGRTATGLGRQLNLDSDSIFIRSSKLYDTLVLLQVVTALIDAASVDHRGQYDTVDSNFVSMLAGTLCWLAWCSHAGLLHMGTFYYAARLAEERKVIRLSRISGLRSACQWWIDRAASGRLRGHRRIATASIPSLRIHLDPSFRTLQPRISRPGAALRDSDNVAAAASGDRADGGAVLCLQGDAAVGTAAWAVIIGLRVLWGRWHPSQLNWSSGGRELYWALQALLRFPEAARGAFIVIGFDNASDAVAVGWGRARGIVERRLMAALFECAEDLGAEVAPWWCSRRMNAWPDELSKCSSSYDARRWCDNHGFELVICDDLRDSYTPGSLARPSS